MLSAHDQNLPAASLAHRPSIPKWPFITGNTVLVLVAYAVWTTAISLSTGQMMFCLGAVALGAVMSITPFALEAFCFGPSRLAPARAPVGDVPAPGAESDWRRQSRAAAEAVEHAARANAALENSARRFDARFAPLVEIHKNLETVAAELREAAAARQTAVAREAQATQRELERLRKEQAEKFKTTETKIAAIEEALSRIAAHLQTLADRPAPALSAVAVAPAKIHARQFAPVRAAEPVAAPVAEPVLVAAGVAEPDAADASFLGSLAAPDLGQPEAATAGEIKAFAPMPTPVPASENMPDAGTPMMDRAIAKTQSSGETPAVAGIIMARSRRSRKSKHPLQPLAEAAPLDVEPPVNVPIAITGTVAPVAVASATAAAIAVSEPLAAPPSAEIPPVEKIVETPAEGETASSLRRSARAKALALRGEEDEEEKKNTPVVFTPPRADESAAAPAAGPTQGELLAREADSIRRKRASRNPLSACSLTAHVLIGIGNKPFVRGAGPGLDQDKGVPMEFVEIGQWRWLAPSVGKEPITVRILKNDEIPAAGDPIVLRPGQSLEVSPVFPG